jgi:hypothetical protein
MRSRVLSFGISLVAMSVWAPSAGFSQVQATQNRIPQQIVINGQMASGAHVTTTEGQIQSFTCPSPQHYTTADGSSQGWACSEQTTGVWLLNAVPPSRAQAAPAPAPIVPQVIPQQPPVVYQQAPPVVVYQTQPAVIYQPAPAVIYQQPPTVIYEPAPTVVYAPVRRPVVVAPAYPSSVVLGAAAIDAAGRIASAAILDSHHSHYYYYGDHDRRHNGRRW